MWRERGRGISNANVKLLQIKRKESPEGGKKKDAGHQGEREEVDGSCLENKTSGVLEGGKGGKKLVEFAQIVDPDAERRGDGGRRGRARKQHLGERRGSSVRRFGGPY